MEDFRAKSDVADGGFRATAALASDLIIENARLATQLATAEHERKRYLLVSEKRRTEVVCLRTLIEKLLDGEPVGKEALPRPAGKAAEEDFWFASETQRLLKATVELSVTARQEVSRVDGACVARSGLVCAVPTPLPEEPELQGEFHGLRSENKLLAVAERERTWLTEENVNLRAESERLVAESARAAAERQRLEEENRNLRADAERVRVEQETIKRLREEVHSLRTEGDNERLTAEQDQLEKEQERVQWEEQIRGLRLESERQSAKGERAAAEQERLAAELAGAEGELQRLRAVEVQIRSDLEQSLVQVAQASEDSAQFALEAQALREEAVRRGDEARALGVELEQAHADLEQTRTSLEQNLEHLAEVSEESAGLAEANGKLRDEKEQLLLVNRQLVAERDRLAEEVRSSANKLNHLERQLQRSKESILEEPYTVDGAEADRDSMGSSLEVTRRTALGLATAETRALFDFSSPPMMGRRPSVPSTTSSMPSLQMVGTFASPATRRSLASMGTPGDCSALSSSRLGPLVSELDETLPLSGPTLALDKTLPLEGSGLAEADAVWEVPREAEPRAAAMPPLAAVASLLAAETGRSPSRAPPPSTPQKVSVGPAAPFVSPLAAVARLLAAEEAVVPAGSLAEEASPVAAAPPAAAKPVLPASDSRTAEEHAAASGAAARFVREILSGAKFTPAAHAQPQAQPKAQPKAQQLRHARSRGVGGVWDSAAASGAWPPMAMRAKAAEACGDKSESSFCATSSSGSDSGSARVNPAPRLRFSTSRRGQVKRTKSFAMGEQAKSKLQAAHGPVVMRQNSLPSKPTSGWNRSTRLSGVASIEAMVLGCRPQPEGRQLAPDEPQSTPNEPQPALNSATEIPKQKTPARGQSPPLSHEGRGLVAGRRVIEGFFVLATDVSGSSCVRMRWPDTVGDKDGAGDSSLEDAVVRDGFCPDPTAFASDSYGGEPFVFSLLETTLDPQGDPGGMLYGCVCGDSGTTAFPSESSNPTSPASSTASTKGRLQNKARTLLQRTISTPGERTSPKSSDAEDFLAATWAPAPHAVPVEKTPSVFCLISRLPLFAFMFEMLQILRGSLSDAGEVLERVNNVGFCERLVSVGVDLSGFPHLIEGSRLFLRLPRPLLCEWRCFADSGMSSAWSAESRTVSRWQVFWGLGWLLERWDNLIGDTLARLLVCVLLEQKVLLLGDVPRVSTVALVLRGLLWPFRWLHLFLAAPPPPGLLQMPLLEATFPMVVSLSKLPHEWGFNTPHELPPEVITGLLAEDCVHIAPSLETAGGLKGKGVKLPGARHGAFLKLTAAVKQKLKDGEISKLEALEAIQEASEAEVRHLAELVRCYAAVQVAAACESLEAGVSDEATLKCLQEQCNFHATQPEVFVGWLKREKAELCTQDTLPFYRTLFGTQLFLDLLYEQIVAQTRAALGGAGHSLSACGREG